MVMVTKANVSCPECEVTIKLNNPRMGQRIKCPNCRTELEIVWLDPVEVDFIYDEEEEENY